MSGGPLIGSHTRPTTHGPRRTIQLVAADLSGGGLLERKSMSTGSISMVQQESVPNTPEAEPNQRWAGFINELMSTHRADFVGWRQPLTIMTQLDHLGRQLRGLHWASLPDGGGIEITGASFAVERGLQLEINNGDYVYLCEPVSLECVASAVSNDWAYFDLQLSGPVPRDKVTGRRGQQKGLGEVWGVDHRKRLAEHTRLLHGRVVICLKGSLVYELVREDGQGRHNLMSRDQFRKFVQARVDRLTECLEEDPEPTVGG
jgi:hypothetical protein